MSSRQAKVARVIPIDTPDNSSSEEGGDGSGDEEEEAANEIQVEFEARGPEEEDRPRFAAQTGSAPSCLLPQLRSRTTRAESRDISCLQIQRRDTLWTLLASLEILFCMSCRF